jgi:hypothetical protein
MLATLALILAQSIPPQGGAIAGYTSGASAHSGSCASWPTSNAPEQVLTWTPTDSGQVTFDTCSLNTKFDTVLYVRSSLNGSELACNDDTAGCATGDGSYGADHHGSRVTLNVTAGQTYYVFVDGYNGSSGGDRGAFQLNVAPPPPAPTPFSYVPPPGVQTVFLIILENMDWSTVKWNGSMPYLNNTLLAQGAHAENYAQTGLHPSGPNYVYLEAGSNLGVTDNSAPSSYNLTTSDHLVRYLDRAGISWRVYSGSLPAGSSCPRQRLQAIDPVLYFLDESTDPSCLAHNRPLSELSADLANNYVARYNLIVLDDCRSGASACSPLWDGFAQADQTLRQLIEPIRASPVYANNAAIFVTWDEGTNRTGTANIGMIVLSPLARAGYENYIAYSPASLLRTVQSIFGVSPYLRDAASATPLDDLFSSPPGR